MDTETAELKSPRKEEERHWELLTCPQDQFFFKYIFQVTELFDKLVKNKPDKIQCQEEKHALNAILKINASDPSSGPLRLPKQNERPTDIKLASGYTSK